MRKFSERHHLALLSCARNINIELINHGHIHPRDSYIVPVFENIADDLIERLVERRINDCVFTEVRIKSLDVPIYIKKDANNNGFKFNKMVMRVSDVKKSIIFWEHFGFKVLQVKKDFSLLEFKSLITEDICQIYLKKSDDVYNKPFLDDEGFNCIAFISNSAKNEKEFLDEKGIETTEIERFALNRRVLNIFFATGPCGELAEIVGLEH